MWRGGGCCLHVTNRFISSSVTFFCPVWQGYNFRVHRLPTSIVLVYPNVLITASIIRGVSLSYHIISYHIYIPEEGTAKEKPRQWNGPQEIRQRYMLYTWNNKYYTNMNMNVRKGTLNTSKYCCAWRQCIICRCCCCCIHTTGIACVIRSTYILYTGPGYSETCRNLLSSFPLVSRHPYTGHYNRVPRRILGAVRLCPPMIASLHRQDRQQ